MNTELLLTLLNLPGMTGKTIERFVSRWSASGAGMQELSDKLGAMLNTAEPSRIPTRRDIAAARAIALKTLERTSRAGITLIHRWQRHYPPRLAALDNPPPVLFVKGSSACLSRTRTITIVGTRNPTDYGANRAAAITERFVAHGFTVVSGLALGCDTSAHRACLRAGGKTVAVLGHGLLRVYPAANRRLAAGIIDEGGCLVSEHPPAEKPKAAYFVMRNRIQSAFGAGVVVIESGIRGGTMHTAAFCVQQAKPLFCLEHPEKYRDHLQVRGNRHLLLQGSARPLTGSGAVESAIEQLLNQTDDPLKPQGSRP